jgi:CheY-like chemotaxis protein
VSGLRILILDDEAERGRRFVRVAQELGFEGVVCETGAALRAWMEEHVGRGALPRLISLDHDYRHDDPDDGVVIARWLVERFAPVPTIVHSSNGDRAQVMLGELELAGWPHARVAGFGEEWIERDWRMAVVEMLGGD